MSRARLIEAFAHVFQLSGLGPGQSAAIVTDGPTLGDYVSVAQEAFGRLGVPAFHLDLAATAQSDDPIAAKGAIGDLLSPHPGAVAALSSCDFVLDLLMTRLGGLLHDASREALATAGTRMLHVSDPPDSLLRQPPSLELRDACLRGAERLSVCSELRVTSAAGTDFSVNMEGARINALYGFAEQPGQASSWPGGYVAGYPVTGSGRGRIVLAPGDLDLTRMTYIQTAVTLEWDDDHVRSIDGAGFDAEVFRDYMAAWDEPEAYGLSHVGWGLNHRSHWWAMALQHPIEGDFTEGRAFAGSFMVSTGVNRAVGRVTRCHFDLPMRNCSVFLDGIAVVEDGVLVEAQVTGRTRVAG